MKVYGRGEGMGKKGDAVLNSDQKKGFQRMKKERKN
jgi:hypothetical protein